MTFPTSAKKLALGLGFLAVVFFALASQAQSLLPVRQIISSIYDYESRIADEQLAAEEKQYGPVNPYAWEPDAFPEAMRSWLLYDVPADVLDEIEQNKDENGEVLL